MHRLALLLCVWVMAVPVFMGIGSLRYEARLASLHPLIEGTYDQVDELCFPGADWRIKNKNWQTGTSGKATQNQVAFFLFYFPIPVFSTLPLPAMASLSASVGWPMATPDLCSSRLFRETEPPETPAFS